MDIFFQEEDRAEYLGKKSNRSPWAPSQNSKVSPGFPLIKLSKWLMLIMPIVALFYTDNAKTSGTDHGFGQQQKKSIYLPYIDRDVS